MSNRVLKKLHGDRDLIVITHGESDDGGSKSSEKPVNNRFELLASCEHSLSDTEAKEDDDREVMPPGSERGKLEKQDSTDSLKRRRRRRKKKLRSQKSTEENLDDLDDEVSASVREVNRLLGEPAAAPRAEPAPHERALLQVETRHLNADNEMRRMFGSRVVQGEQNKKKNRGRKHGRSTILVSHRNWPTFQKSGVSMRLVESKDDVHFFAFEHSKQYQTIQMQFLDAVESFNPDNIAALLNMHTYHIDALIQFSDICKMGDNSQMAAELIERAIFYLESCFHPLFNIASGNCRLDFRITENRGFYIVLFKHLIFIGQRGCCRTSLEVCKLLLSLDPDGDPLAVTLALDYYALRCGQHAFLLRVWREWGSARNLQQLPNFAYSAALAARGLAIEEDRPMHEADTMLQEALVMFPGLLLLLLDKCNVEPDKVVASHPLFNRTSDPPALQQLQKLYVERAHALWKQPEVLRWLEGQVHEVLRRHSSGDPYFEECEQKRKIRYTQSPRNVMRHIILSDIRDTSVQLLQDQTSTPIFGFDPFPPTDSISSYNRPPRPITSAESSALGLFLRSLMPNFNMQQQAGEAEAAHGAEGRDLRFSVTSLMDAMRDLISSIHLGDGPNEADVPNEGDDESDDNQR